MKRERPVGFEEFTKTYSGIASIFLPAFFQSCSGGEGAQKRRPRLLILLPDSVFLVQACFIYRLVRYVGRAHKHDGSIGQCIADPWTKQRLVKFLCRFSVPHQAFPHQRQRLRSGLSGLINPKSPRTVRCSHICKSSCTSAWAVGNANGIREHATNVIAPGKAFQPDAGSNSEIRSVYSLSEYSKSG